VAPSRAIHAVREPALDSRGYVWPALEGPASAAVRSYVSDVEALAVAHAYDQAYDARDVERMVAMVHEDVEAVTPRGTMRGHAPLRAFMARAELWGLVARDRTPVLLPWYSCRANGAT
jgi:hypothetical protein